MRIFFQQKGDKLFKQQLQYDAAAWEILLKRRIVIDLWGAFVAPLPSGSAHTETNENRVQLFLVTVSRDADKDITLLHTLCLWMNDRIRKKQTNENGQNK